MHGVRQRLPRSAPLPAAADQVFDRLARLARSSLGASMGLVTMVDAGRQVMPGADGLPEDLDAARQMPLSMSICQYVVRHGEPFIVTDISVDERLAGMQVATALDARAYAGMPIVDHTGTTVGALCVIDVAERTWTQDELDVLADLAASCSAELQLRQVLRISAAAQARVALLLELSQSLAAATTIAEITACVHVLAAGHLSASSGGITIVDELTGELAYVDNSDDLHPLAQEIFRSLAVLDAADTAASVHSDRPLFVGSLAGFAHEFPVAAEIALYVGRAFACLPLRIDAHTAGTLVLAWKDERDFSADDRDLMTAFARYTVQALQRAQLLTRRQRTALALHRSPLPQVPVVPGLELCGRYCPAVRSDSAGGDWYDAIVLADGSLNLVVGDVAGHDTPAAAAMGQIIAAVRALTIDGARPPSLLLNALDRVMHSLAHRRTATAVVATFTAGTERTVFTWSNAGHPPPLVLVPDEPPRYLEHPPDRLLGVPLEPGTRADHSTDLPPGATLLVYTDGLVQRRHRDLDEGLALLTDVADRFRDRELPNMVDAVIDSVGDRDHDDDIVVFAVRRPAG